jgi:two-component system sensor histidine kinase/response regulator
VTDPVDRSVLDTLVARLGDRGPEFRRTLVTTWSTEAATRRAEIEAAAAAADPEALARVAHTLRSAGGALGATALAALCGRVEDTCRDGGCRPDEVGDLAGQVRAELDRADAALQALAAE